jgi:hypothetical protein
MQPMVVRARNASAVSGVYAGTDRVGDPSPTKPGGGAIVQTAKPRDVGALALVVALFIVLFVLSLTLGSPVH